VKKGEEVEVEEWKRRRLWKRVREWNELNAVIVY